jgi:formylglycine-generating enzyme required for sulfatase activity
VCDMVGGAQQWCENSYERRPIGSIVNHAATSGSEELLSVTRGGAWLSTPGLCRPAGRFGARRGRTLSGIGFRSVYTY